VEASEGDPDSAELPLPRVRTAEEEARALAAQVSRILAVGTGVWVLCAAIERVAGHPTAAKFPGAAALGTGALLVLVRARGRLAPVCAHGAAAFAAGALLGVAMVTGQTRSPVLWVLLCIPLLVAIVRGPRAAAVWGGACVAMVGAVEVWRERAPIAPEYLIDGPDLAGRIVVTFVVMLALTFAGSQAYRKQIAAARQREKTIEDLLALSAKNARELRAARDLAVAASQAKGDFLAVMSHEIRTPLNAVLGLAGLLLDAPLSPEQREIVRMIRSSGDTLLGLVNDVLDFSKIEAGRLTLEEAPFDVRDCMEDALDLFAAQAAEKGIDLHYHAAPDVPRALLGDAARVRQILVNFVSNAIKFTPRGSVEVRAEANDVEGRPDMVELHCRVRDTGIGVPEDRLPLLFESFSQADASTTRRFGGTGLGLAICRSLAQRMGGRVWAESARGEGSTFHFAFPVRIVLSGDHDVITLESKRTAGSCLIACGREGTRRSVSEQIRALGVTVASCASAEEAAEVLDRKPAAIVVADEAAATERLRAAMDAAKPRPRLVLLTSAGKGPEANRRLREAWPGARAIPSPPRRVILQDAIVALARGEEPEELPTTDAAAPALGAKLPMRILVAEDNPVNQQVIKLLLDRLGYRIDVVANGVEAIEAVRARPYDLVLMDMAMPEMDGVEAARAIRQSIPEERQPRIIALTANATREDRERCEEAGMNDFLSKPVMTADLVRVIQGSAPRLSSGPPPRPSWDSTVIEGLRRLARAQEGMFEQIVESYLEAAERLLGEIAAALDAGDGAAAALAAHSLKGAAGQMGAVAVTRHAASVEEAASRGAFDEARIALAALRAAQGVTAKELSREAGHAG
jgi:signal transduction histidine kinase/CheY-like chemotaxis protein/HPt (histidine-containing phosphotransfer) domain-containing protein